MKGLILRRRKLGLGSCKGIKEASKTGLDFVRNDLATPEDYEGVDLVFRWGCTSNVPVGKVVNKAEAIHLVNDKKQFRMQLQEKNPLLVPTTFTDVDEANEFMEQTGKSLVVRPSKHSQGKNLWVVSNYDELVVALEKIHGGWYSSELVKKVSEHRVFVVQGRVVWVANKIPCNPDDIAWNVAKGGKFENVKWGSWDLNMVNTAIAGFNESGLDFGGVDIMTDENGCSYVIEINSAPSQTSPYRQSCTAKAFDYICENGKEHLGLNNQHPKDNWRHYIHPAIWSKGED